MAAASKTNKTNSSTPNHVLDASAGVPASGRRSMCWTRDTPDRVGRRISGQKNSGERGSHGS